MDLRWEICFLDGVAERWQLADQSRDELARRIREQAREIERLKRDKADVERDRDRLQRERDRLERERDRLRDELEAAHRTAKRQAAPFAKGPPTATPKRPGRKAGRHYGPRRWRPPPAHVDAVVAVFPPAACPHCGDAVVETGDVRVQYQADIPSVRPYVTAFHCHVGRCQGCHRQVAGRDARQTSTATGAAASQVGPTVVAWAAWLHTGLGVPLAKVATILRTGFGLTITAGGLVPRRSTASGRAPRRPTTPWCAPCSAVPWSRPTRRGGRSAGGYGGSGRS